MTKRELIEEITRLNPTAMPAFLAGFKDTDLAEYLKHLTWVASPRVSFRAVPVQRIVPPSETHVSEPVLDQESETQLAAAVEPTPAELTPAKQTIEAQDETTESTAAPALVEAVAPAETVAVATAGETVAASVNDQPADQSAPAEESSSAQTALAVAQAPADAQPAPFAQNQDKQEEPESWMF